MVPMLTFGIPGAPIMAIMRGVLAIKGIQPGPQLMTDQAALIGPMLAALLFSALVLIPLPLWLIGPYFIKIGRRDALWSNLIQPFNRHVPISSVDPSSSIGACRRCNPLRHISPQTKPPEHPHPTPERTCRRHGLPDGPLPLAGPRSAPRPPTPSTSY